MVPRQFERYIEPFLGSGAVFFALKPKTAILSDLNAELIATFAEIKKNAGAVTSILRKYHELHSKNFYYQLRRSRPESGTARAARFIYLNRTCWNGLYRVNTLGQFNVPIGTKQNVLLDSDNFWEVSTLLRRASLIASDFEPIILQARRGDLVFADPPYITAHSHNGFLKYNETLFKWEDQVRLRNCLLGATDRGAYVLATNADTIAIRKLYEDRFTIRSVIRSSVLAADSARRGNRTEIVITS